MSVAMVVGVVMEFMLVARMAVVMSAVGVLRVSVPMGMRMTMVMRMTVVMRMTMVVAVVMIVVVVVVVRMRVSLAWAMAVVVTVDMAMVAAGPVHMHGGPRGGLAKRRHRCHRLPRAARLGRCCKFRSLQGNPVDKAKPNVAAETASATPVWVGGNCDGADVVAIQVVHKELQRAPIGVLYEVQEVIRGCENLLRVANNVVGIRLQPCSLSRRVGVDV
jgi:hypothetical protein